MTERLFILTNNRNLGDKYIYIKLSIDSRKIIFKTPKIMSFSMEGLNHSRRITRNQTKIIESALSISYIQSQEAISSLLKIFRLGQNWRDDNSNKE